MTTSISSEAQKSFFLTGGDVKNQDREGGIPGMSTPKLGLSLSFFYKFKYNSFNFFIGNFYIFL